MSRPGTAAGSADRAVIIGAGVVGCATAWALAKAGRKVLLIDRDEPAIAGASFGNVGHIATEQLQPLPSPSLLLSFWRQLYAFGGPLDLPFRRIVALTPWFARFALAAFHRRRHTESLAPLVRCSADTLELQLGEVGRRDLLRRNGHYAIWLGAKAKARAAVERARASALQIRTAEAPPELMHAVNDRAAKAPSRAGHSPAAGVWFPDSAHVLDPASVAQAFAAAAIQSGSAFARTSVRSLQPRGDSVEILTDTDSLTARTVIICAGAWSAPLLAPFGLNAPLEAERGYHVELPQHPPLIDAPILYADHSVVVTPMSSRLRATSYLEFAGLTAPADPRKPARLREKLQLLGYRCDRDGPGWMGPRPTLPDYLPGIGRARGTHDVYYAVGHQHLGLTLAAITAELVADLVTGRSTRFNTAAFDLSRFGGRYAGRGLHPE